MEILIFMTAVIVAGMCGYLVGKANAYERAATLSSILIMGIDDYLATVYGEEKIVSKAIRMDKIDSKKIKEKYSNYL